MIHYITTNGIGNAWVEAELEVLKRRNVPFVLHTLRRPERHFFRNPLADQINHETRPIYPLSKFSFLVSIVLAPFLFGTCFWSAFFNALTGQRESLRGRYVGIYHLFVAAHWARQLQRFSAQEPVSLIHSQWIHSCGTVGMYGAWLLGVPFSFTGHAVDLFRDRVALKDKIRRAIFIVCISEFHRQFYLENGAKPEQLYIVYCGIDTSAFAFQHRPRKAKFRILSVGRLVEKKGFADLILACRLLVDKGYKIECEIGGDGPLEAPLNDLIQSHGLEEHVLLPGRPIQQEDLPAFLASGDAFAQPCVWSSDNDVDGTPRTLMEAMASGIPSVSTNLAGIPDIIKDGKSGLLVNPGDTNQLANALQRLMDDEEFAERLAIGGRNAIIENFRLDECVYPLVALFEHWIQLPGNATSQPSKASQQ